MNEKDLNKRSATNWERLAAMPDEEIDTAGVPPLNESFFKNAKMRMPKHKETVLVSVDAEVLAWFRRQDGDFQSRVNAALKIYAEAHQF